MATLETQVLDEVIASSRRKMLSFGGAALAGLMFSGSALAQTTTAAPTDADILNFALNLEYLEANFYTLAATGMTIDMLAKPIGIDGAGTQGTVTTKPGGPTACKVPFKNMLVQSYAMEVAQEERNHVAFLRGALGAVAAGTQVAQPALDLYNSFSNLARFLGLGLTSFDPFADDASFLLGSYIFEDVGVTAYTGAAPLLTNKTYLSAAAGIQGVEAYHSGLIRTTIYGLDQNANMLQGAMVPAGMLRTVATAISALRNSVDRLGIYGPTRMQGDDIGLGTQMVALNGTSQTYMASTLVDASTTGSINAPDPKSGTAGSLVFARPAANVLPIVYVNGAGKGGFFPAGLNGTIK